MPINLTNKEEQVRSPTNPKDVGFTEAVQEKRSGEVVSEVRWDVMELEQSLSKERVWRQK